VDGAAGKELYRQPRIPGLVAGAGSAVILNCESARLRGMNVICSDEELEARAGIEPAHEGFAVRMFNLSC
jgi:hypothetical protein